MIWSIILGFIAGVLARAYMPGAQELGALGSALLAISGATAGGIAGRLFLRAEPGASFNPAALLSCFLL